MTENSGAARLFFALWPDAAARHALGRFGRALQRRCGGNTIPARHLHLTLVFLGNVARDRVAQLEALAGAIRAARFDLQVDRVEHWRHNRIVWAGASSWPDALPLLVKRLESELSSAGFPLDGRPYVPHVTLLRNARRAPADSAMRSIAWPVAAFTLVESVARDRGRAYEVLQEWPLGA